jgi:hypothetical protein
MNQFLGPLDSAQRIPPLQQTRIASFLISAHGALAKQLAINLPGQLKAGWQTELNAQLHREAEIVSLLMRATSWVPDFTLPYQALTWEAAWLPKAVPGISDQMLAMTRLNGGADRLANRLELVALQEADLRLDEAAAFEFDPAQRDDEGIVRRHLCRQQGRRPDCAVNGMPKGGDVDGHRKNLVGNSGNSLRQPGCLPCQRLVWQREIRHP